MFILNQLTLVGRLVDYPTTKEVKNGKIVSNFTLAVQRSFKNENGEYDVDYIDCSGWGSVATSMSQYLKKGDLVGVRGRLSTNNKNGKSELQVVTEKVTFLSASKNIDKSDSYDEPNISL